MKRFCLVIILLLALLCSCAAADGESMPRLDDDVPSSRTVSVGECRDEVRGVWIASVFNINYPSSAWLDEASLADELDVILDNCEKCSLNTVVFQVRPACDALYDSELFPVSSFLSHDGVLRFDPLTYLTEKAHERGISVHAWVNPLRVTVSPDSAPTLPDDSPAVLHPDWTVKYADGKLYLNAGIPEVREYVADGVREIVEKYDVDGVVFDDYFYPYPTGGADFDDADTFEKYGSGSVADWRRENINGLVKSCYDAAKSVREDCLFGVSPGGVWQNDDGENGGSATRGFETYESLYCDTLAWAKGGYVDYIAPQIYWSFDENAAPFGVLNDWWNASLDGTGVDFLIAHGAYRYEDWDSPSGEMTKQVEAARQCLSYKGSLFYGYADIAENLCGISDELSAVFDKKIAYFAPCSAGSVALDSNEYPAGTATIGGTSDPTLPLTLDGVPVSREKCGAFTVEYDVKNGENELVFTLGGKEYVITGYGK